MADSIHNIGDWAPFAPAEDGHFCYQQGEILSQVSWEVVLTEDANKELPRILYNDAAGLLLSDDETNNPIPVHLRSGYRSPTPELALEVEAPVPPVAAGVPVPSVEAQLNAWESSSSSTDSSSDESEEDLFADMPLPKNDDSQDDDFEPSFLKRGQRSQQQTSCNTVLNTTAVRRGRGRAVGIGRKVTTHSGSPVQPTLPLNSGIRSTAKTPTQLPMPTPAPEVIHIEVSEEDYEPRKASVRLGKRVARDESSPPHGDYDGDEPPRKAGVRLGKRVAQANTDLQSVGDSDHDLPMENATKQAKADTQTAEQDADKDLLDRQVRAWDLKKKVDDLYAKKLVSGPGHSEKSQSKLNVAIREYDEHVERYGVPVPTERPVTESKRLSSSGGAR